MTLQDLTDAYDFTSRTIVITGGTGVLGREIVRALTGCGATVALLARDPGRARRVLGDVGLDGGPVRILRTDILDPGSLRAAAEEVVREFGAIEGLINAAGGNMPGATTSADLPFFDIAPAELRSVLDLNLLGTILPTQVFGRVMADRGTGVILNIASMTSLRPLTRVVGYSAAKAAVSNFTQWLAVHLAQEVGPGIRVNAVAPGFFLTDQNRFLLTEGESGALTARGTQILAHTPLGRFGEPADLVGAVLWLLSPLSSFVTGVVLPVDGGFAAYSGV